MRRLLAAVTALAATILGAGAWRASTLPAPSGPSGTEVSWSRDVRVAYHVHTRRSDGTGTVEEVARAARDAGVDVVILTDHGDATRAPEPPRRVAGVLVLDAVEISTWGGHYVALGAAPSPYPLAGEPDAVAEDVARLGGFGIAAHPGSSRDGLRWRGWDAPYEGLEWLNADSEWRDRPRDLWGWALSYPWAPVATLTAMLNRPAAELAAWDRRLARQPAVGLAAHDAHARVGLRGMGEPYDGAVAIRAPWYTPMFGTFTNVVEGVRTDHWGEEATADASAVLDGIRAGRVYAVVTGRGASRVATFRATAGRGEAVMGGHLVPDGPVRFMFEAQAPGTATTTLVCDGRTVAQHAGGSLDWTSGPAPPGACRIEVALDAPDGMPWIVTNPIYARPVLARPVPAALMPARQSVVVPGSGDAAAWTREVPDGARVEIAPGAGGPDRLTVRWALGGGTSTFAAASLAAPAGLAAFDRIGFQAVADRPMRIWLQLRSPADGGRRWGRSFYLDTTPREVTVPFSALLPLDGQPAGPVPLERITALLLVADTVHHRPGGEGAVTFGPWWVAR